MQDLALTEAGDLRIENGDLVFSSDLQTIEQNKFFLLQGKGSNRFAPYLGVALNTLKNSSFSNINRIFVENASLDNAILADFSISEAGRIDFNLVY